MRSSRAGLSEYTTQRLAELQALRESSDDTAVNSTTGRATSPDHQRRDKRTHHFSTDDDEGIGSSRGASSSSSAGVVSPGGSGDPRGPSPARVALPSAILESRGQSSTRVGYASLALPPDGAYRPLRSRLYGGETYESYIRHTGSDVVITTETQIDPLPVVSAASLHREKSAAVERPEETRRKSLTLGSQLEDGKKSLAVKADDGCIGFATLPDQVHRKAIKRGFDFTLMVVGESGLGKSTLISSMFFQNELYSDRTLPNAEGKISKTVEIQRRHLEIEEHGVRLRLTIVDTPGFNDALNCSDCWKSVNRYIQDQFEQYLKDESGLNRQTMQDNRVHCLLYFISPYGRGLRPVDIDFMRRLQHRVNIVPIIAKADVLTPSELKQLKFRVMEELRKLNIKVYELPPTENDEDADFKQIDKELKAAYPFSVIGGNAVIEVDGRKVRGRVYPWGIVEAENPEFSNVALLRRFLVSTHLHDLKDVTKDVHYENFRANVIDHNGNTILQKGESKTDANKLLREKEEEIKRMHMILQKMQSKMYSGNVR